MPHQAKFAEEREESTAEGLNLSNQSFYTASAIRTSRQ
jgi:hypothetical protein